MKKVLAIISNYGYWGVEYIGPREKLLAAGYEIDVTTPTGARPIALPPSYDSNYIDPPLNVCVTKPEDAEKVIAVENDKYNELATPISLNNWFPERPYHSKENFLREFENYYTELEKAQQDLDKYDGLLLVGGSGPIVDLVNNQRVHDVILAFYKKQKPIAAICYAVACLAMARDFSERVSIIKGKHVTGHCIEYDYKDGTGFVGTDFNMGPPPYVLEYMLRDAVGDQGQYHGNFGKYMSVIVDYPFITARSLQGSYVFGEKFIDVMEKGTKRYGW